MNLPRRICGKAGAGLLVCLLACTVSMPLWAQSEEGAAERKVITRVEPKYPPTLERLYIGGIVRLQVEIAANGTVESAQLLGGNPILGQAAIAAVKQWKYAPASHKTQQVEKLEFDPHR
ncbi:MAG TPA: energy transducer TonB [Candidatus Sulfotelmatobacter sp.]|nr:energy transducer TonB [Candidatus Sulfotelmatobacter sp.]